MHPPPLQLQLLLALAASPYHASPASAPCPQRAPVVHGQQGHQGLQLDLAHRQRQLADRAA